MKPILLFGITLLIFPEQAWPQDSVSKPPLIHSVCIQPGYRFAGNNGSLTGFRPEAEMSHHYRITDYGYLSACINLVPARKMTVTLAAQVSSFKATEQYLFGFVEPMNFEVSFDQLAFYLSADYLFSHGWKFLMAGQLLSGVQPLMVWQEQPLGGEFVAAPNPYRDWLFYGAASKRAGRLNLEVSGGYAKFRAKPAGQAGLRLQADLSRNGITLVEGSATWVADTLDPKRNPPISRKTEPKVGHIERDEKHNVNLLINDEIAVWQARTNNSTTTSAIHKGGAVSLTRGTVIRFGDGRRVMVVAE